MSAQRTIDTVVSATNIPQHGVQCTYQNSIIADNLELSCSATQLVLKTIQTGQFVIRDLITLRYCLAPFRLPPPVLLRPVSSEPEFLRASGDGETARDYRSYYRPGDSRRSDRHLC